MNEKEFLTMVLAMLKGQEESFDVDKSIDYAYDTNEWLSTQMIPLIEGRLGGLA